MDLLFDKNDDGVEELRKYLPGLYSSEEFEVLQGYLENAASDLQQLISKAVYEKAVTHYESADFGADTHKTLNKLVYLIQDPCAKAAYLEWAPVNDLKHDGNGRRMHVDEASKAPWEWMLYNADQAVFRQYHKAVNRLLNFLDDSELSEWKASDQFKSRASLFCRKAVDIDPVNQSYWFHLKTLQFNIDAQEEDLRVILGKDRYEAIVTKLKDGGELDSDQKVLLSKGKKLIRHLVMIRACQELPVEFLPEGTVQRYNSDRAGKAASTPASDTMLDRALIYHRHESKRAMAGLQEKIRQMQIADDTYVKPEGSDPVAQKFFRP